MLVGHHLQRIGAWATGAFTHDPRRWRDIYAGACVLSPEAVGEIAADERTHDIWAHLLGVNAYRVPGFLDVGTPEGFRIAQEWKK